MTNTKMMHRANKHAALAAICEAVRATVSAARTIVMHGAVCEVDCPASVAQPKLASFSNKCQH